MENPIVATSAGRPAVGLGVALVLALGAFAVGGCSPFGLAGSGDIVSETREVSGFDHVALGGSGTVRIEIGDQDRLVIEADDNLLEHLTSDVRDGTLELDQRRTVRPSRDVVYRVTIRDVSGLRLSGSGDISMSGASGGQLDLVLSGSGSIHLMDVNVDSLGAELTGSGDLELSGAAGEVAVFVGGSGSYAGGDLVSATAQVEISGSGDAIVHPSDHLDVEISGSGDVEYLGQPTVDETITGSGSVTRR